MLCRQSLLVGLAVVVLGLPLGATAARAEDDATKKELKALCGQWSSQKTDLSEKLRLSPDGAYTDDFDGVPSGGTFTIDPTKKPRTLDLVSSDGTTTLCIYELKGKELTVATCDDPGKRPRDFSGKGVHVVKYKKDE